MEWIASFAHIATNQKAVAEKGWGSLNYNLLLHPEIQLTSTSNLQTEANNNQPAFSIPPSGRINNEIQGITVTLVDQVVQYRNREDARNGINLDKLACQRKETVLMAIASNKATMHIWSSCRCRQVLVGSWSGRWPAKRQKKCRVSERIRK